MRESDLTAAELRRVLGTYITGVTVITTRDQRGRKFGVTVNSFTSVSLDPPLILWCQAITSASHVAFQGAERFAVNILADDQIAISRQFATVKKDKFDDIPTREGLGGLPLIDGCAASLECTTRDMLPGGDHTIFIGHVDRIHHNRRRPLAFGGGHYLSAQPHEATMSSDLSTRNLAHLHAVRLAGSMLPGLAEELNAMIAVSVWGDGGPTVIRWEQPPIPLSAYLRTGRLCQLTSTATGSIFAAFSPEAITAPFIESELISTQHCHKNPRSTRSEITSWYRDIRERKVSRVLDRRSATVSAGPHIDALSVPVFDAYGDLALALTSVAPAFTIDMTLDGPSRSLLQHAANKISTRLRAHAN